MRIELTGWNNPDAQSGMNVAGGGYVSKGSTPEEFVSAIVDACCGDSR